MSRLNKDEVSKQVVGLTVEQAEKLHDIQVIEADGAGFCITCEYISSRVNVKTQDGIITEVHHIG